MDSLLKISGSVSDMQSDEPITDVNIMVRESNLGTTSNRLGEFNLYIKQLPVILEFSHVGYETKKIRLEVPPLFELEIKLEREIKEISGVTITSQKIDTIFKDREYSVMDYALMDEGILLLIYKYKLTRSELLFLDYDGNILAKLNVLPGKPLLLFEGCMGNIHLITKLSAYQIFLSDGRITLLPPVQAEYFKEVMSNCLFSQNEKLFFREVLFYDLVNRYFYIDLADSSKHLFCEVMDEDRINFLFNNPENMISGKGNANLDLNNLKGFPEDAGILAKIRYMDVEKRFNRMVYFPEIYAPLFRFGDTLLLFNHPNDLIQLYGLNNSLITEIPIKYHLTEPINAMSTLLNSFAKSNKWDEKIFVDEPTKNIYTIFLNINGTRDIFEIDLLTGQTEYTLTIPFPYVEKISIKNNSIYFIYRGWGETQKKKLFRQQFR
jgi:hypothetical protein